MDVVLVVEDLLETKELSVIATLVAPTTKASQSMTLSDKTVTQDVKVVDVAAEVLVELASSTDTAVESEVIPRSKLLMDGVLPKVVLNSPTSKLVMLLPRPTPRKMVKHQPRPPLKTLSQKIPASLTPITSLN